MVLLLVPVLLLLLVVLAAIAAAPACSSSCPSSCSITALMAAATAATAANAADVLPGRCFEGSCHCYCLVPASKAGFVAGQADGPRCCSPSRSMTSSWKKEDREGDKRKILV